MRRACNITELLAFPWSERGLGWGVGLRVEGLMALCTLDSLASNESMQALG